jgi:ADP-dependent NAD(P)H-hydrate dehydratase / NAD(P)H-hydrate epimerase
MNLISSAGSRNLDAFANGEFGFADGQLMECAGLRAWLALKDELGPSPAVKSLVFVCGRGNNAGDALVMARFALYDGFGRLAVLLARLEGDGDGLPGSPLFARQLFLARRLGITVFLADAPSGLVSLHPGETAFPKPPADRVDGMGSPTRVADLLSQADVIVDGITGSGLHGPLAEPYSSLVSAINAAKSPFRNGLAATSARFSQEVSSAAACRASSVGPSRPLVVSVDLPSGLGEGWRASFPTVKADLTLAIERPKTCCYYPAARSFWGRLLPVVGVFPPEASARIPGPVLLNDEAPSSVLPPFPADSYKNRRGFVAVFAGRVGTTGAAKLSSAAAARAGAGLVRLFTPSDAYSLIVGSLSGIMALPWDPAAGAAGAAGAVAGPDGPDLTPYTAFLAGPGWGILPENSSWLGLLLASGLPGVIDADALSLLPDTGKTGVLGAAKEARFVLTPHPGEFSRLSGLPSASVLENPEAPLAEAVRRTGAVVVLKSHVTWIASPDGRLAVYDGLDPAMGTGGSGDVLAGIIAGVLSGGVGAFEAACAGVRIHAEAGRLAGARTGLFLAEELCEAVSAAAARYRL